MHCLFVCLINLCAKYCCLGKSQGSLSIVMFIYRSEGRQ
uniref:Uncharacterized protein n=1 Tax=Rhizophora mucronata TaxID=61149 RepID=A0A2P2PUE7_RHIMU